MKSGHPPRRYPLQVLLAMMCGAIVLIVVFSLQKPAVPESASAEPLSIGIEHAGRSDISITASRDANPGLLQIRSNGSGTVVLILPIEAKLREVRGMALQAVVSSTSSGTSKRWQLLSGITFSFTIPFSPSTLTIESPSDAPLLLKTRSIELKTGNVVDDSVLMQRGRTVVW